MTSQSPFLYRFLQHPLGRTLCYLLAYLLIVEPILWALPTKRIELNPFKWFDFLTPTAEAAKNAANPDVVCFCTQVIWLPIRW
jgi:hypothetical protein